jgi:ribonuclease PH
MMASASLPEEIRISRAIPRPPARSPGNMPVRIFVGTYQELPGMRHDGRAFDEIRSVTIQRDFVGSAAGSVLITAGRTTILCTASLEESVPAWKKAGLAADETPSGWVTAEYNMLPGSTTPRKARDRTRIDGRTTEIQRLIGRSLRAVVDFQALGPRTITLDCDVLEADGGTRTLGITGAFIALCDALARCPELEPSRVVSDSVAAISVGVIEQDPLLDLDYSEDVRADVDLNVVMTGRGEFVEVQGTAEGRTFDRGMFDRQLDLATRGIRELTILQRESLGNRWPLDTI